jgi:hypothetical protein
MDTQPQRLEASLNVFMCKIYSNKDAYLTQAEFASLPSGFGQGVMSP